MNDKLQAGRRPKEIEQLPVEEVISKELAKRQISSQVARERYPGRLFNSGRLVFRRYAPMNSEPKSRIAVRQFRFVATYPKEAHRTAAGSRWRTAPGVRD